MNPVPVSVCRALGAEVVIAVNLNGDITSRNVAPRRARRRLPAPRQPEPDLFNKLSAALARRSSAAPPASCPVSCCGRGRGDRGSSRCSPGTIYIMQDRITRSRMAGDPPDVMVAPQLGHIRLLDFHRAEEAIDEGYACVAPLLGTIERAVATSTGA